MLASSVQQRDSAMYIYDIKMCVCVCVYTFLFEIFSIIDYYKILNIVSCAIQ